MPDYRSSQGRRLALEAAEAAEVRDALTHPDVVALRVDKIRTLADRLIWCGITIGLLFTMINVQVFAAQKASTFSLSWWAAWFLDPAVTVVLLGILIAESITAKWQIPMGQWARVAKWSLLAATYVMNTWDAWATGWWAGAALHSVPPLVVFAAAECRTEIQDKLTECIHRAHAAAVARAAEKAAKQQAKRDEDTRVALVKSRRDELERLDHEEKVAAAQSRISSLANPPQPAVEQAAVRAPQGGRKPRSKTTKSHGRRRAWDVDVLVRHARPILAKEDIESRKLASRLSEQLNTDVPRYWAQKAKDRIAEEDSNRPPLRAVVH